MEIFTSNETIVTEITVMKSLQAPRENLLRTLFKLKLERNALWFLTVHV